MSEDIEVLKHKAVHKGELCFEGLYIDKCKRLVVRNENEIELTYTEFEILLLLAQNAGIVFSKEQIYDSVWKEPYFGDYNIVMSHIRNIREKIEDNPSKPVYIQTVWVRLELKCIADVGLVGFPNVGKSTFLSRVTNARPKIANYHFTTLNPNLGVVDIDGGKGFVIADIPGLIEGASEGVGLGHQFLRHIERTKVIIHIVDAASTEGRDPIADIKAINAELEAYNPDLLKRPQVIAANKIDAIYDDGSGTNPVELIKAAFEPEGIKVYPISAVTGQGVKELLYAVRELLDNFPDDVVIFEKEFDVDELLDNSDDNYNVYIDENGVFIVEGERIDKMLGYTNLESEKGFNFFQKFMKSSGAIDRLEELGIEEGDTVRVGDYLEFDYYRA